MRNELQQLPQVKLRPIFVDVMPPFEGHDKFHFIAEGFRLLNPQDVHTLSGH